MTSDFQTQRPPTSPSEPTRLEDPLGVIGRTIGGKYEIKQHLGAGGFGEVYEAINVNLRDQRLVVKFFKRIQAREKFDKEARILCKLDHPNISRVVDYLPEDSAIVIHRIDGQDAETQLWEAGPLPSEQLLNVARTMAEAIAYAHSQGIAHRDLKPSNILIDKNGHVYLIDFGIAKEIGGTATKTGRVALTPNFAAPERHAGIQSYNPFLSDIYELGVTLYNLGTRSLPYHNPASPALSEWRTNAGQKFAPAFRRILKKAMDPDPAQRYASAVDMSRDLARVKAAYATPTRKLFVVAGVVVAALAVAWTARERIAPPAESPAQALAAGSQALPITAPEEPLAKPIEPASAPATAGPVDSVGNTQGGTVGTETPARADAPSEEPPAEITPVVREPAKPPKPKPDAAKPVLATQTVYISPVDPLTRIIIAGRTERPDRPFEIRSGDYRITVIHPDFPLFSQPLLVEAGKEAAVTYDLASVFAGRAPARMQVAIVPPAESQLLRLSLNGRDHNFSRFPVLDFEVLAGEWSMGFDVMPLNGAPGRPPIVDSSLYYAGGSRAPVRIPGDGEPVTIAPGRGRILVFWSPQ